MRTGTGKTGQQLSWSIPGVSAGDGSAATDTGVVRLDDARSLPDGTLGVGAFHITEEVGERPRADPAEGRESRFTELLEGHIAGAQEPGAVFTQRQRIAKLAGDDPDRAFFCPIVSGRSS
ncbi:MAG: hypothetical protein ACRERU_13980 [Methylococcales bacterium]